MLFSDTFIILALMQLFTIEKNKDAKAIVFNASLFIALAVTFSVHAAALLIIPLFVVLTTRTFVWREVVLSFIAFLTVLIYLVFYHYFYQLNSSIPLKEKPPFENNLQIYILAVWATTIISAFFIRKMTILNPGIRTEKILNIFTLGLLLMLLVSIAFYLSRNIVVVHFALFSALYAAYVFIQSKNKFLLKMLFYGLVLFGVFYYINIF